MGRSETWLLQNWYALKKVKEPHSEILMVIDGTKIHFIVIVF